MQTEITDRFLFIKHVGGGFWSDIHDVQTKLLLAEITNRQPIVYWGGNGCCYSTDEISNAFEQYYYPVSEFSVGDVLNDKYTYYPPTFNFFNLIRDDPNKWSGIYRDVPHYVNCDANVLVSDLNCCVNSLLMPDITPWIKEGHPAYGMKEDDIHRYISNKYMKLKPDILDEIEGFYHAHMENQLILAVHVRSGGKILEVPNLLEINSTYPSIINSYLSKNPSARIFLLTDNEAILEQYEQQYGDILIYTDCTRKTPNDDDLSSKVFTSARRRKGIEIIKDTYLACKCDSFIGNARSNVSMAIRRLKVWGNDKIKLLS